jgi:4-amino-4-deoxy-L-arabinose transferase-like glycosyltransferase
VNPLNKRPNADQLLLAAVWVTISFSTIVWTVRDRTPPPWDPADHLSAAYDYFQPIAHADFGGFVKEFFLEHHYYAPLVHLVTGFFYLILGPSRLSGIAVNLLSLALLLYSVHWIGGRLYGKPQPSEALAALRLDDADGNLISSRYHVSAGALAAAMAACYHFTAWLAHDAFLDYPLTAVVAASFALLINAGDFKSRRPAIYFGIAAGLGLLTKQTFGFFLALPAVYVTIRVLVSRDRRSIMNLAMSGLIAAAIAAVWYWPHINDVIEIYKINQQGAIDENEAPLFSFMSNVFYLHGLVSAQIQLFFGLLVVFGLVYSLLRMRRQSIMLYLWLASGVAAFTCIANKDMRYTVPVLPAAALLSVCWASDPGKAASSPASKFATRRRLVQRLKTAMSVFVVGWAAISFFNAQWPGSSEGIYIDTPRFRWIVFGRNYFGFDHAPQRDNWSVPEIIGTTVALGEEARPGQAAGASASLKPISEAPHDQTRTVGETTARPTLGVVVNLPYLNPSSIALYSRLLAPKRGGLPLLNVEWLVNDSARARLTSCDYILVRTGLAEADWVSSMERIADLEIRSHPEEFLKVASFPIPLRNAEAVIYKCTR